MDATTRVQTLDKAVYILHSAYTLWENMNLINHAKAMGK